MRAVLRANALALDLFDKYFMLPSAPNVHKEAEKRGVKVGLLLMDRAFFTTACINLPEERGIDFITPCVCTARVQSAVDSLEREEVLPFSIHDNDSRKVAPFTMVVCWSERRKKLIPFATNVRGRSAKRLVRMIPTEYRRRWGVEAPFRKVKGSLRQDALPFTRDKAGILHDGDDTL